MAWQLNGKRRKVKKKACNSHTRIKIVCFQCTHLIWLQINASTTPTQPLYFITICMRE